jgi:uncharacterized membrane protein YphA (DoxX/SURF4 family)
MFDRRRYLNTFAVLSLVLLRLVIGWHFFREGTEKVEFDRHDRQFHLAFTAEGFLSGAKGPLADWYQAQAPDGHGWRRLLTTPRQYASPTKEDSAHHDWAKRIEGDWRDMLAKAKSLPGVTDDQQEQADAALDARLEQLHEYLAAEADAIAEYRHELWRLTNWRDAPEAGQVPFVDERISTKAAETSGQPVRWVREVGELGAQFRAELRRIVSTGKEDQALFAAAAQRALTDPRERRLEMLNIVVTVLTISVGVSLLLGLFTRLASVVGALFLLSVIAAQPPWLYDAAETMPQVIEFVALLVVAGSGAGRWLGLDIFIYALFNRS